MFAIVRPGSRPRATYTHEGLARENLRDPAEEVVPVADDVDLTAVIWDGEHRRWVSARAVPTPLEARRQSEDYRVRRAQAYAERLDTGVINEVLLDIALTLAADPALWARLRQSTRDKLRAVQAVIHAVKTDHAAPKIEDR